jgi:hypothetical protein
MCAYLDDLLFFPGLSKTMIENAGGHMVDHGVHTPLIDHLEVPVSGNDIPDHQQ